MIGDKLVITDYHRRGARLVMDKLAPMLEAAAGRVLAVSVAGESGSGKSEIAHCLGELAEQQGRHYVILGQDDYFKLPPRSNHERRLEDISWVG
ncbi:MAG: adenylylsulfate kinase, partial [Deltaproteobacteria bacterium]